VYRTGIDRKVDELIERCRARGMNVTPQRMAIYRALLEADDHPSPEALYRRVRPDMPSMSLATIYKALDALVSLGLAQEVSATGDVKRYDANMTRHHHLVCTGCGAIRDLEDEVLDEIAPPRRLNGFVPQSVSVQISGLCSTCSEEDRGSRRRSPY
jgi:Fur family transcriptional regulator, peroxide stress response regulator